MKYKNTLQKGSVRYIIFREEGIWYGVALEFNIVESGDDPREVLVRLLEATKGYLVSAKKIKARPQILNQEAESEYESLWNKLEAKPGGRGIPYDIYTYGRQLIPA